MYPSTDMSAALKHALSRPLTNTHEEVPVRLDAKPKVIVLGNPLPLIDVITKGKVDFKGSTDDLGLLPSFLKRCDADSLIVFAETTGAGTSIGGKDLTDMLRTITRAYPGLRIAVLTGEVNGKNKALFSSLGEINVRLVFSAPWDMEEVIKRLSEGWGDDTVGRALPASPDLSGIPQSPTVPLETGPRGKEVDVRSQAYQVDYDPRRWVNHQGTLAWLGTGSVSREVLPPQVIAVYGPRAGSGKTFIATNVAAFFAEQIGEGVILLDFDTKHADAGLYLDLSPNPNIVDFLPYSFDASGDVFRKYLQKHAPSNLSVLLGPPRPELSDLVTPEHVVTALSLSKATHKICVIDTPSDPTSDLLPVCLEEAWAVVLVASQDAASLRHLKICMDLARRSGAAIEKKSCLVINRIAGNLPLGPRQVEEFLGLEKSFGIPEDRTLVESSVLSGRPIALSRNGNCEIGRVLRQIAKSLYPSLEADSNGEHLEEHVDTNRKRSAFFFWRHHRAR